MIWFKRQRYDWTYYVDVFDDSIIGSDVKPFYHGVSMKNHRDALQDMLNDKIKRGYKSQETIFHSDQGIIYSSVAFNNAHKDYNIKKFSTIINDEVPTDKPGLICYDSYWQDMLGNVDLNADPDVSKVSSITALIDQKIEENFTKGLAPIGRPLTIFKRNR